MILKNYIKKHNLDILMGSCEEFKTEKKNSIDLRIGDRIIYFTYKNKTNVINHKEGYVIKVDKKAKRTQLMIKQLNFIGVWKLNLTPLIHVYRQVRIETLVEQIKILTNELNKISKHKRK